MPDRRGSSKRPYRIDPAVAHERAVIGARSRTGVDYHIRKLAEKLAESAGALSPEQFDQLRALLPPAAPH